MAVHRIPLLGYASGPDGSGNVWVEPAIVKQATAPFRGLQYIFKDTATKDGLHGRFMVPKNLVASAQVKLVWAVNATTGVAVWNFDYSTFPTGASFNVSGFEESVAVTSTCPSAAHLSFESSLDLTTANLGAAEVVEFIISRNGATGDTIAADIALRGAWLEYSDV